MKYFSALSHHLDQACALGLIGVSMHPQEASLNTVIFSMVFETALSPR